MKWLVNKSNSRIFDELSSYQNEIKVPFADKIRIYGTAYILGWSNTFRIYDVNSNKIIWEPKTSGNTEKIDVIIETGKDIILGFYSHDPGAGFTGEKILDLNIYTEDDTEFNNIDPEPTPLEEKKKSKLKYIIGIIFFILFFLVIFFSLFSCSTRKKTTEKERIRIEKDTVFIKDSIYIYRNRTVTPPSVNTEVIPNPCDSLGKLKDFNKTIKFPGGIANLKSEDGNIKAQINTDSISSVTEKQYQERNDKQIQQISELQKENTTLKITPFNWWFWGCIVSLVVNGILIFLYIKKKFFGW